MARWYGYSLATTRELLITEFFMLDGFLARHPPLDLLEAARLGFKSPDASPALTNRQAIRANTKALAQLPPRKRAKTIKSLPAYVNTPEHQALIAEVKAQWQTNSG